MSPKRENKDIYLIAVLNVVSGAVLWLWSEQSQSNLRAISEQSQSNLRAISEQSQSKEHKLIAPIAIEAFA